MRVLMLVSEAPPIKSGIARVAGELTEGLRRLGFIVDVLSANEIRRWAFKEYRISSLAFSWPQLQRELGRYDILHIHGSVPTFSEVGLLLGALGRTLGPPNTGIVYTHHSDIDIAGLDWATHLYNSIHHRLLHLADYVVASTPSYALQLQQRGPAGRVAAVGFGVDAARFRTNLPKAERFTVLFVGQLRPYKGVDTLLRAWQGLAGADLHIVGEGHERGSLEELARQLNLQNVHFHGAVSDDRLAEFYARSHVLVLPSNRRAEAFGLVLLEGMAAGCVPVASELPGVSDVVGTSGYTFPIGDSAALARILQELRDNPALREAITLRATARSLTYNWQETAEAYAGIYQHVYLRRRLDVGLRRQGSSPAVLHGWFGDVARMAQSERASLMLMDASARELRIATSVGLGADVVASTHVPIGQRMAGLAAQTGRSILVRPRGMPAVARLYLSNPHLGSALILPLRHQGRPVGVLNLARGPAQFSFTPSDQRWLERLAGQIAPLLSGRSLLGARVPAQPAPSLLDPVRVGPALQADEAFAASQ